MIELAGTFLLVQSSHPGAPGEGVFGMLPAWDEAALPDPSICPWLALLIPLLRPPSHPGGIMAHDSDSSRSFSAAETVE